MSPFQRLFACVVSKKVDTFLSPGLEVRKCLSPLDGHVDLCFHPKRGPERNELDCLIGHLFSMITLAAALSDLRSLEWRSNENQIWFNIFLKSPNILKCKSLMHGHNKINLGISCWSNMRFITHNCYEELGISCIMDYAGEIWCVRQKVKALT